MSPTGQTKGAPLAPRNARRIDHRAEAERLLAEVESYPVIHTTRQAHVAEAHVHATLAVLDALTAGAPGRPTARKPSASKEPTP